MAIYIHRAYGGDKQSDYFLRKARHQAQFAQMDTMRSSDTAKGNFAFGLLVAEIGMVKHKIARKYAYSKINLPRDRDAWVAAFKIDEGKTAGKKLGEKTAFYSSERTMPKTEDRYYCAEAKLLAYFSGELNRYVGAHSTVGCYKLYIYTDYSPCESCKARINNFHRDMSSSTGKTLDIIIFYSRQYQEVEYKEWSQLKYGDSYNKVPKPRTPTSGAPSAKTPPKPTDKDHFPALGKK